jgi:hypothetical protein
VRYFKSHRLFFPMRSAKPEAILMLSHFMLMIQLMSAHMLA